MKIASCQSPDFRESLADALAFVECNAASASAAGVRVVCFPECFLQGYLTDAVLARRHALACDSAAFHDILDRLKDAQPMLIFGMIESDGESLYNTAVVIDHGRLIGRYRKTNLLPGEYVFTPTDSFPVFDVDGLRFGINICSDTQLREPASAVAAGGAKVIFCPANNMMKRESAERWKHRHNETRALRARENGVWFVSADVTGESADRISYGPTCVIDPQGAIVAQVPLMQVGMVVVDVDFDRV